MQCTRFYVFFFADRNIQNYGCPTVFFCRVSFSPKCVKNLGGAVDEGSDCRRYPLALPSAVYCVHCVQGPNKYSVEWTPLCLIESSYLCSYKVVIPTCPRLTRSPRAHPTIHLAPRPIFNVFSRRSEIHFANPTVFCIVVRVVIAHAPTLGHLPFHTFCLPR